MESVVEQVREIIEPICEQEHVALVDLEFRGAGKNQVLSVFVDRKEDGITLEHITRLNNEISDQLDMHDVIKGSYRLEVSSPGLDRPLKYLWQYRKNINRKLQVVYDEEGKRKEVTGKLLEAGENEIVLQSKRDMVYIPYSNIIKSKVKLSV